MLRHKLNYGGEKLVHWKLHYTKNYKILLKEIKEDIYKWKAILCS